MLEAAVYERIGKLPRVGALDVAPSIRKPYIRSLAINVASEIRPLSAFKWVVVESTSLSGYRSTLGNVYMVKAGDSIKFKARFRNNARVPMVSNLSVGAGGDEVKYKVVFGRGATYDLEVSHTPSGPEILSCRASACTGRGLLSSDEVYKSYPIGMYDDRYKPTSEYPVSGADNAILDVEYSWSVGSDVYPRDVPSGLSISNMSASLDGAIDFMGKKFRDPSRYLRAKLRATIVNNTGYDLIAKTWGVPVAVLYDDNRHVSQADSGASLSDASIPNGSSKSYELSVDIPNWCYGKVAIAHAIRFYRGDTLFWTGGPFFKFEVFRIRLP